MPRVIKIDIHIKSREESDILISTLSDIAYYAFEETPEVLSAYIKEADYDEQRLKEVVPDYSKSIIEETNWNAKWESEFIPVVVDNFVAIRAHFHQPITNVKHEIIITPKMSFGTGHHATTYLMLQHMKHIDFSNKKVLDFGTGTGVLAILANKLGGTVTAIDNDDWSIDNARENFQVNNCKGIELIKAESPLYNRKYDIILANINLNVILENIEQIVNSSHKDSLVITSGILVSDSENLQNAFASFGFILSQRAEREGWACLSFRF
jgi:ribosomal protein L11 methyltransferase